MHKNFPFRQKTNDFPYICVYCGDPCKSLYYQLGSSLSSIKVLTCNKCGEIIDPYIEREWLHIAIDCILMRDEAYRHVLYNSSIFQDSSTRQRIKLLLVWACLDSYLKWESQRIDFGESSELLRSKTFIVSLVISSLLGRLTEWLAVSSYCRLKSNQKSEKKKSSASDILFLALLLPSSFTIVTIAVMMWENTKTVRLLGSLLMAYWQGLAISVVTNDFLGVGILFAVRVLVQIAVSAIFGIPCIGLQLDVEPFGRAVCIVG